MKFTKLIIFVLLINLLTPENVRAQSYKALLAQFNEWHITSCYFGCITNVYYTDADTIVNGYTYNILDGFHYINRNFLLREDTAAKQVFLLLTGVGKDDFEYLLYDFSLVPGDSMPVYNPLSPFPDSAGYFTVDSIIPEVLIDGDTYRHFYLSASDSIQAGTAHTEWIEGIGSLGLINTPGANPDINGAGALSCFFNNLTLHYSNLDSITGCIQENIDLSLDSKTLKQRITVYPNPANDIVNITTDIHNITDVKIYDGVGKMHLSFSFNQLTQSFSLNTRTLSKGVFFLKVTTNEHSTYVSKLIIK
ncbi:MAG: T9SS type A sorting domain-containing protein [Crocinitomicaceae bacterium]